MKNVNDVKLKERTEIIRFIRLLAKGSRESAKTHLSSVLIRALNNEADTLEELADLLVDIEFSE